MAGLDRQREMFGRRSCTVRYQQIDLGLSQRRILARQRDMGADHLAAFVYELERLPGLQRGTPAFEGCLCQRHFHERRLLREEIGEDRVLLVETAAVMIAQVEDERLRIPVFG